jgi:Arrestin (or S-antigen), N-terminal domain
MTDGVSKGALSWNESSGGVEWHLELDRSILLPAQLVTGRLSLQANRNVDARGLVIALTATEHWKHRETHSDGQGHTTTTVVTSRSDVTHEPVQLRGEVHLGEGGTLATDFELPVPADAPASLHADDAGLDWTVEAKLDVPGGVDSRIERAVVVAQPTALLRAGAVPLGEFALYESVDATADESKASIELKPAPLVCGAPFTGRITLRAASNTKVRGVRGELRVHVQATVSAGGSQTITLWTAQLAGTPVGDSQDIAGDQSFEIRGTLPAMPVPSIELPHGRTNAEFHVILDRPFAPDTHLQRDVAIATTAEI